MTEDFKRIEAYGKLVAQKIDTFVEKFYTWLAELPEFDRYFSDSAKLERVKKLQLAYWEEFFRGRVDSHYVDQRELVGNVHARIGWHVCYRGTRYWGAGQSDSSRIPVGRGPVWYDGRLA